MIHDIKNKLSTNIVPIIVGIGILMCGIGIYVWQQIHREPVLELKVFSLKSGRSTFIRTPSDQRILIDGGSNNEIIRHISSSVPFYSRRIDAVFVTSLLDKNVSGLISVIQRYDVGHIYVPAVKLESNSSTTRSTTIAYDILIRDAKNKNITITEVSEDDVVSYGNVSVGIVFPTKDVSFVYSKASAPDMVISISYNKHVVLFLGDVSTKIQKYITQKQYASDNTLHKTASSTIHAKGGSSVDVMVVSHSASFSNISNELIVQTKPRYLVYSKLITKATKPIKKNTAVFPGSSSDKKSPVKVPAKTPIKTPPDSLASIVMQNRFNIKESGTVRIAIDSSWLYIKK